MMELIYQMMVGKLSKTIEEFTETKKYLVTDLVKNKTKESTYEFDTVKKELRVVDIDSKNKTYLKSHLLKRGLIQVQK